MAAIFVEGLPQDATDAFLMAFAVLYVGGLLPATVLVRNRRELREWHSTVVALHDLGYEDLKAKLKLMEPEED